MDEKRVEITTGFVQAEYNFWVGKYMDKFYDGLLTKKIIGNKCPTCAKVFVPPRKICGKCFETIDFDNHWVELDGIGTLLNFTTTPYMITEAGKEKTSETTLIGMVRFEGSDTAVVYKILGVEEQGLKIGLKMQVVWNDSLKGCPSDIKGFTPFRGA